MNIGSNSSVPSDPLGLFQRSEKPTRAAPLEMLPIIDNVKKFVSVQIGMLNTQISVDEKTFENLKKLCKEKPITDKEKPITDEAVAFKMRVNEEFLKKIASGKGPCGDLKRVNIESSKVWWLEDPKELEGLLNSAKSKSKNLKLRLHQFRGFL